MDIDREVNQGDIEVALKRVSFCLDHFEKGGFKDGVDWGTTVTGDDRLTLEEIIGALVSAEQILKDEVTFN
jgi:hypothetical protein